MASFSMSSFGLFVMGLFQGLFTAPSWQTFLLLSCGWALTTERHTLTTYLWLAAQWVPTGEPVVIAVDDSTKKKAGLQIEGVAHYRNGAGSARQEYRTLRGLNWSRPLVPVKWLGSRRGTSAG